MCKSCIHHNFPYSNLDNDEVISLHKYPNKSMITPDLNIDIEILKSYSKLNSFDSQNNEPDGINKSDCNYYDIESFCKKSSNYKNSFNILHSNICSLQANFENLCLLLARTNLKFDIISLSETWNPLKKKHLFAPGLLPEFGKYYGISGTTRNSGSGFFISNKIVFIPRTDIDIHHWDKINQNEFEAIWIEVINPKSKNMIIASIYRHPSKIDDGSFNNYLQSTLTKLNKEDKKYCINW